MADNSNKPKYEFQLEPLASDKLFQPPRWIIKGIWPRDRLTLFKGRPGAYKSFNTVAMNLCAWTGLPFCGRSVKRCKPFYIGADDPEELRLRAQAWVKFHENQLRELDVPLDFTDAMLLGRAVNFTKPDEIQRALGEIKRQFKPDTITIDTFFHSTVGGDLSQPDKVLPVIACIEKFLVDLGTRTGLLVHHTPKDGKGFWGSVIIEGTVDVMIHCEVNETIPDTATLTCERMKGDRKFHPIDVTLKTQVIKTLPDEDGVDEVDQLVVVSGAPSVKKSKEEEKRIEEEEDLGMMLLFLEQFLGNRATHGQWLAQMQKYAGGPTGKEAKGWSKASFNRRLDVLKERGWVVVVGGAPSRTRTNQGEFYSVSDKAPGHRKSTDTTGASTGEAVSEPNQSHKKWSHVSAPKGAETGETTFLGPEAVSKLSHETGETGETTSRESRDEASPPINDDESGLVDEAIQQLKKGGK
jgi:hypothetical protein